METSQNSIPQEEIEMIRWSFSTKKNRSSSWYMIAGTILLSFVFWGFFTGMYAMGIALLVFGGVYALVDTNAADTVEVALNANGFFVDRAFYEFSQIAYFCFLYDRWVPSALRLRFNSTTLKQMDLYGLEQLNVPELRQFLLQFLTEEANKKMGMDDRLINQLKL